MEMGGLDTGGTGVHRFSLDRDKKLIYASASATGYQGNITMIVDFSDPAKPKEIGQMVGPRSMDCRRGEAHLAGNRGEDPSPQPLG